MDHPFKWRHYQPEIILLCVRWYLRYSLSYRDVAEMMAERGLSIDHTTIYRWVQRYAPELKRRVRAHLKPTNDSWLFWLVYYSGTSKVVVRALFWQRL